MKPALTATLIGGALLAISACAPPPDRQGQTTSETARGAQPAPVQTGVTVSGAARIGVTRTIN